MFDYQGSPIHWIRWLPCVSAADDQIPSHGLVRIVDIDPATDTLTVGKPDTDGQPVYVNGMMDLTLGAYGNVTRDWPAVALYDENDGAPSPGETWGAGVGSYLLRRGNAGFRIVGGANAGRVLVEDAGGGGGSNVRPVFVTGPAISGRYPARIDYRDENTPDWFPVDPAQFVWAIGYNEEALSTDKRYKGLFVSTNPADGVPVYAVTEAGGGTVPAFLGAMVRPRTTHIIPQGGQSLLLPLNIDTPIYHRGSVLGADDRYLQLAPQILWHVGFALETTVQNRAGVTGTINVFVENNGLPDLSYPAALRIPTAFPAEATIISASGDILLPSPRTDFIGLSVYNGTNKTIQISDVFSRFWARRAAWEDL